MVGDSVVARAEMPSPLVSSGAPRPRLVHVTTTDMSLVLLLGPQLEAFGRAGFEVIGASAPGPYVQDLRTAGIEHVALRHATRSMAPGRDAAAFAELVALFRRLRPDVVHTHNPKPGVYGRLAARAAGVPVVINTVHGLYATPADSWKRRASVYTLERLAAMCSQAELVQNPEDYDTLARVGVPVAKLAVIGNGVDLARFGPRPDQREAARAQLGVAPGEVAVGVVSRLVWEKGYAEVFEAAARLRAQAPAVRFVVVGPSDPDKSDAVRDADLERAAREGGVRYLGLRHDVEELYQGFDLYVLASHREGFPRSAMEASACGIPVVASNIRGCRQVVEHEVTGLLFPVRDVAALVDAVAALAGDRSRRERMGRAAATKALAEFDQARIVRTTLEAYRRLMPYGGTGSTGAQAESRWPRVAEAYDREIDDAALMHATQIDEGFLSYLGAGFLGRLYRRAARSKRSFVLVARDRGGQVVGFLAGTEDTAELYRAFLRYDAVFAIPRAAPRLATRWREAFETLAYGRRPSSLPGQPVAAELLSMAVLPSRRGQGIGRRLVEAFVAEMLRRGVPSARVVVAAGNRAAIGTYQSCGFLHAGTLALHRGRDSEVLVWGP